MEKKISKNKHINIYFFKKDFFERNRKKNKKNKKEKEIIF
jgi:hypothetical protein